MLQQSPLTLIFMLSSEMTISCLKSRCHHIEYVFFFYNLGLIMSLENELAPLIEELRQVVEVT